MKQELDVIYNPAYPAHCRLDLFLPANRASFPCPLFIYFHGGGLEGGEKAISPALQALTKKGAAVASATYRQYPHAKFPDFLEDAANAIAFLHNYGGPEKLFHNIYIGGSSAGAYIAMMLYFNP